LNRQGLDVKKIFLAVLAVTALGATVRGVEFQVATNGSDSNPGTKRAPFRTIQRAAERAQAGDRVIVREGVYRERIDPPRGGTSESKRITYQAASGERVEIKGSEVVTNWMKVQGNVWKTVIPNSFFGAFNPYSDPIHGDWFSANNRQHHTGAVYLNSSWLTEAATLDDVLKPVGKSPFWFGRVDAANTTIWAQFNTDPRRQLVEINARQTVFYPSKTNVNYITVRGFTLCDAATPWAPPTAEQIGLIGPHWSKGWIIESNIICYSTCSGVSLGKYGDQWDNTSADTAEGYVKTIERALTNGWSKENVGHHIVRDNDISNCEQAGVVGSLGAIFSSVIGNNIHDIHVRRLFGGAEMAGIKFHGAIDVQIQHNHIYRSCLGLWLDWMAQGTRVSGNVFHENDQDVFVEVDHGPFLMDNNLFLSPASLVSRSQGGAYAHNLFAGAIRVNTFDDRQTPFLKPHSAELGGFHNNPRGDDRYYNNLFIGHASLRDYDDSALPVWMLGNIFLQGATPSAQEKEPLLRPRFDPALKVRSAHDGLNLEVALDPSWATLQTHPLVTTALLGRAIIPDAAFENADGSPLRLNTDYFGKKRHATKPFPGPFEIRKDAHWIVKIR
jgi:alpha-N-arabinofuranosidase